MANKFNGEKSFKIGTKSHKLKLNLNASAEIEDMADEPYSEFLGRNFSKGIVRIKPAMIIFKCAYIEANGCNIQEAGEIAEAYYQSAGTMAIQSLVTDFVIEQMTLGNKGVEEGTEGN